MEVVFYSYFRIKPFPNRTNPAGRIDIHVNFHLKLVYLEHDFAGSVIPVSTARSILLLVSTQEAEIQGDSHRSRVTLLLTNPFCTINGRSSFRYGKSFFHPYSDSESSSVGPWQIKLFYLGKPFSVNNVFPVKPACLYGWLRCAELPSLPQF
ncbi:hypothetical protein J6590_013638 [Homalodisca vitripennis]|nr:hypothetical protein J6590_013638 [Homalodisca vitripennis]